MSFQNAGHVGPGRIGLGGVGWGRVRSVSRVVRWVVGQSVGWAGGLSSWMSVHYLVYCCMHLFSAL